MTEEFEILKKKLVPTGTDGLSKSVLIPKRFLKNFPEKEVWLLGNSFVIISPTKQDAEKIIKLIKRKRKKRKGRHPSLPRVRSSTDSQPSSPEEASDS